MESITVAEARGRLEKALDIRRDIPIERIPLEESLGRIVCEDIMAPTDIPPFPKSPYDGYAVSLKNGLINEYRIVGVIGAGEVWPSIVGDGEAVRIMTGAPIPQGADTVIMQERCNRNGQLLQVKGFVTQGENIIAQGEECRAGTCIMSAGMVITENVRTVLAGLGIAFVKVYAPPRVLVVTTGREVVGIHQPLKAGEIYNSNYYMLEGLLRAEGIRQLTWLHIADGPESLEEGLQCLRENLGEADIIISTGGVSVGDYDIMPALYEKLGAETLYRRIQMRPGAASYAAYDKKGRLFWGLSGNPAAAYNAFWLLVVPVLRQLMGRRNCELTRFICPINKEIVKKNPFDRYIQGHLAIDKGQVVFEPNALFTSSALLGLQTAQVLGIVPAGKHNCAAGESIEVILLQTRDVLGIEA